MSTTRWSTAGSVVAVSVGITLFWVLAFASGSVSPMRGINRLRGASENVGSARRIAEALPFPWRYGALLTDYQRAGVRETIGEFRFLLVVTLPYDSTTASTLDFVRLLGRRHNRDGVRSVAISNSGPELELLDLLQIRAFDRSTLLLDLDGRVRFAFASVPSPDVLRQVVERAAWGRAENAPPVIPTDPELWDRRLRRAQLSALDGEPLDAVTVLSRYRYLVVFDAHCSRCAVLQQLRDLAAIKGSLAATALSPIAAVIPRHYTRSLARASLDSVSVDWMVAAETIAPELALVTRDLPQAAPVLLKLQGGAVQLVQQLAGGGTW